MLQVAGNRIIDNTKNPVRLRGTCLGGWMNMEGFITGYPGNEEAMREAMRAEMGEERYTRFFDRLLKVFFTDNDATYLRSLGFNVLRIPINYRHFEDDMRPFELKEEGFARLDRVIQVCARHEIYTIIDLHALPGYQNQHWHSDNPTQVAFLWKHRHFQDRVVHLWEELAKRYRGNPWLAGYNLINEPADPSGVMLVALYDRLIEAIRAIDPDHIIFLDGNRFSRDWRDFPSPWPNTVYALHYYPPPGQITGGDYPTQINGEVFDEETMRRELLRRSSYMLEHDVPIWVGEFGPVYPPETPPDSPRYQVLRDQLEILSELNAHWTTWPYKDVGLQGIVFAAPNSPYINHVRPVLEKIQYLGADIWSSRDDNIAHVLKPLGNLLEEFAPEYDPYPFGASTRIQRLLRGILLPDALIPAYARLFHDLGNDELDSLADSFAFDQCVEHKLLAQILKEAAGL